MDSLRKSNLSVEDTLRAIEKMFSANARLYASARICYAMVRSQDSWQNAVCVAQVYPQGRAQSPRKELLYSDIHLRETWLSPGDLLAHLQKRVLPLEGLDVHFPDNKWWERLLVPSRNDLTKEPAAIFTTRWQDNVSIPFQENLLAYDLPYYPDSLTAIKQWCDLPAHRGSDGKDGNFILILPECRARFEQLSLSSGRLVVTVTKANTDTSELRIKGACYDGDTFIIVDQSVAAGTAEIELPDNPDRLELFLIDSDGSIHDHHREAVFWSQGQNRLLGNGPGQDIGEAEMLLAVESGEGPNIEFKPYIDPKHQKTEELVKTAIAFANTGGGVILIGVDNNCAIIGIERELEKTRVKRGISLDQKREEYIGELKQTINGRVGPHIDLRVKMVKLAGHSILSISVPEGKTKPYHDVRNNLIYVRRGASTVQPNIEQLRELVVQQNHWPQ